MEEEAKRRTLLRYIHAVKAAASLGLDDESHKNMTAAVGRPGRGIIQVWAGQARWWRAWEGWGFERFVSLQLLLSRLSVDFIGNSSASFVPSSND